MKDTPQNWHSQVCHILLPIVSVQTDAPEFPAAFRQFLLRLKEARTGTSSAELVTWVKDWLQKLMETPNLDEGIKTVGYSVLSSMEGSGE